MEKPSFLLSIIFSVLVLYSSACSSESEENTLRIAAASNLRYALEEINVEFKKETNIKVEMSVASSGKLTAQIQNGAPFDVFLSADKKYPFYLYKNGFANEKPKLFCSGLLVYWTNKDLKLKGNILEVSAKKIQKIAIANPKNAPFGQATVEALKSISIYDSILPKIIFAENVSQISQYVLNKNVDIGFSSKSLVLSPKLLNKGKWFDVNKKLYKPVEQYILLLKSDQENAKKYYEFLFTPSAQNILKKYGYEVLKH